jgi:tripartite-type tricarboxylate transporter receptor subunit TctC
MRTVDKISGGLAFVAWAALAAPASAQDAASFYKGKQITVLIGSSAGGGYDTYGRLLSRHLGRHIPGHPTVVASNMPGAGSTVAANHIMTVAPKDGTFIAIVFASVILEPLLGDAGRQKFDASKIVFVGNANKEVFGCVVRAQSDVKSFEDMRKREVVTGASAAGGATIDFPSMLNTFLGTKIRMVRGYPGTREITLAIEKGEVEGACGVAWSTISVRYPRAIAEGQPLRLILQEDMAGHPVLNAAAIPTSGQIAKGDAERQALALFYAQNEFGRPFIASPEVPADRLAALRAAFDAAMKDPELLADAKKLNVDVIASTGEQAQAIVSRIYATSPAIVARVRTALGRDK